MFLVVQHDLKQFSVTELNISYPVTLNSVNFGWLYLSLSLRVTSMDSKTQVALQDLNEE